MGWLINTSVIQPESFKILRNHLGVVSSSETEEDEAIQVSHDKTLPDLAMYNKFEMQACRSIGT
jgi:hypothetical protein